MEVTINTTLKRLEASWASQERIKRVLKRCEDVREELSWGLHVPFFDRHDITFIRGEYHDSLNAAIKAITWVENPLKNVLQIAEDETVVLGKTLHREVQAALYACEALHKLKKEGGK